MKTVLITGAGGNLGQASVLHFAAAGYNVISTVSPGKKLGYDVTDNVTTLPVDLIREDQVEKAVGEIIETHSNLDAALLLAGGFAMGNIKNTNTDSLHKMLRLNFETAYNTIRPVFQQMLSQPRGGRIIMISSRPALLAKEGKDKLAYGLSKSLIIKLAAYLNAEGASKNVKVAVIVPSTIDTEENRKSMPNADFNAWVKPEEIAETMAFLCSEKTDSFRDTVIKMYGRV